MALSRARTEQELLQSICDAITTEPAYVLAFVSVAETDPASSLRFAAVSGTALAFLRGLRLGWHETDPDGQGPSGFCIRTKSLQIIHDLEADPNFVRWRERAGKFGIRSAIAIPLSIENAWNGTLTVFSSKAGAFESEPIKVFQQLGDQIVHGLLALRHKQQLDAAHESLERTQQQLLNALSASVSAMVTAMESRDSYTAGHEVRVAEISTAIGRAMDLDDWTLQGIRLAAMVHDMGKISIPTELLAKPAKLTPAEFEFFRAHPETGYAILKDVPFPWPVALMVRQHHEKLDGSGYPLGLKGDDLLLESKIIAVADMVEAMASDRPYRKSLGLHTALEEVESMAGTKLDADVVKVCAMLFREKRLAIPSLKWGHNPRRAKGSTELPK